MQLLNEAHVRLDADPDGYRRVHLFDEQSRLAVNAALLLRQPLLVMGEPGVGKSQLAEAAAHALERHFESFTVSSHTEVRDLFWTVDAVRRLSEAQLLNAVYSVEAAGRRGTDGEAETAKTKDARLEAVRRDLDVANFVEPGPLWFGFNHSDARAQYKRFHGHSHREDGRDLHGAVVLLDEIDKADASVPNGLLEALGDRRFPGPPGQGDIVQGGTADEGPPPPLIVITTNGERDLSNAFFRRCVVLRLRIPDDAEAFFFERGKAHFEEVPEGRKKPDDDVLREAARLVAADRKNRPHPPRAGQGEYLSLVKAVCELAPQDPERQRELLAEVRPLTSGKFGGPPRSKPEAGDG